MPYDQSASVYDAIYTAKKNYGQEAERLHELIEQFKQTTDRRLLDVACGTGLHDQYLIQWYKVEGLDLSSAQLAIARQRLPELTFYQDDMVMFDLQAQYGVVTCLFSAIGHLTELAKMRAGIANMARHILPGGVLFVEPWLTPEMWQDGHMSVEHGSSDDCTVARLTRSLRTGRHTHLEMHHLVGRPDGVEYFVEHHDTTLYTVDEYLAAFHDAGLEAWYNKEGINTNGRGIFIGQRPLA